MNNIDLPRSPIPLNKQSFPKINLSEVVSLYEHLVGQALDQVEQGTFSEALATIIEATKIVYLVNWRYHDDRLEGALATISSNVLAREETEPAEQERVVFFDSWGLDARGLSLQYIRALTALNVPLLFICESRNEPASVHLRKELNASPEATVLYLDHELDEIEKARQIHDATTAFRPSRIMLHMNPWAVGAITAFHAFPKVKKYQINLTDHAFWLGAQCADYSIEFRKYGETITQTNRKIPTSRTIINPYYPIVEDSQTDAAPERSEDDIVVLTGGAFYKMYGRDGFFFDLIAGLLDDHKNVTVWIAGNGRTTLLEKRLGRFIETGRVKLIGNRKDINAIMQLSDIYLSTYPVCGALMAQIAAAHNTPVLSFTSKDLVINELEDIIGTSTDLNITTTDVETFRKTASELINSVRKRADLAAKTENTMHKREGFEDRVAAIFAKTDDDIYPATELIEIDHDAVASLYLEIENYFQDQLARRILHNTTLKSFLKFPSISTKAAIQVAYFMVLKLVLKK